MSGIFRLLDTRTYHKKKEKAAVKILKGLIIFPISLLQSKKFAKQLKKYLRLTRPQDTVTVDSQAILVTSFDRLENSVLEAFYVHAQNLYWVTRLLCPWCPPER